VKQYIIAAGLVIVLAFSFVFTNDTNTLFEQKKKLNYVAQDMSNAAALFYDEEYFSKGYIVFNEAEGEKAAAHILKDKFGMNGLKASNDYYQDAFTYDIYFYDDSLTMRHYHNGVKVDSKAFIYHNEIFTDSKGVRHTIKVPTVISEVNAGKPSFHADLFDELNVKVKSTGLYEYVD